MMVKEVEELRVELNKYANNLYLGFLQNEFKLLLEKLPPESELPKDFLLQKSKTFPLAELFGVIKPIIEREGFPAALRVRVEALISNHSISNDRVVG